MDTTLPSTLVDPVPSRTFVEGMQRPVFSRRLRPSVHRPCNSDCKRFIRRALASPQPCGFASQDPELRNPEYPARFGKTSGPTGWEPASAATAILTFGIDTACQSICSHTWQEAESRIATPGAFLETDERTVANHFTFSNVVLRSGMTEQLRHFGLQIGLEVRSCAWRVEQDDHPEGPVRDQDEAWPGWKPAIGTRVRFDDIDLQWTTRVAWGTGVPRVATPLSGRRPRARRLRI